MLGLPLGRQNLLFNYFAATLAAEIAAAKAEGRYSEGVSDLQVRNVIVQCYVHCVRQVNRVVCRVTMKMTDEDEEENGRLAVWPDRKARLVRTAALSLW